MDEYRTIVADPPWPYDSAGTGLFARTPCLDGRPSRKAQDTGYPLLAVRDIASLSFKADADAHLYLWTTNSFMCEAHEVAKAWGFIPKTILTWVKTHQDNVSRVSMKSGYYFRGATEHIIFGVRGSLRLQVPEGLPTAFLWPRTPHSVKPEAFYDLVEQASPGPYLELFARRNRLGWDTWGNEALNHVEMST